MPTFASYRMAEEILRFFRRFMAGLFNREQASKSEPALRKLWFSGSILDTTRDVGAGGRKDRL